MVGAVADGLLRAQRCAVRYTLSSTSAVFYVLWRADVYWLREGQRVKRRVTNGSGRGCCCCC